MNLIDAVKSGRPFRRTKWLKWAVIHEDHDNGLGVLMDKDWMAFRGEDLTADDYEIQEFAVTITRTQFLSAARQTWEDDFDYTRQHPEQFSLMLARKLGLESE